MGVLEIILSILIILSSIAVIASVLMQQSRQQGIGAIGGAAEAMFGKVKARGLDAKLAKVTKYGAIVFVILSLAMVFIRR